MFQPRSSEFDPRVSAIVDHLRAIETELGAIGKIAGRRASAGASATANQVVDAILPILGDLTDRVRRGQQTALAEAKGAGADAVKAGVRVGNDALDRLGDQAKQRPLFIVAVTLGIGMLIGFATRWDWNE
jgi:hypothetical protein